VLEIVSPDRTFVKNAYLGDTLTIDKKNHSYTLQPQDFMSPTGNTGSDSSVIYSLQQYLFNSNTRMHGDGSFALFRMHGDGSFALFKQAFSDTEPFSFLILLA
jgi:hypothetical protein